MVTTRARSLSNWRNRSENSAGCVQILSISFESNRFLTMYSPEFRLDFQTWKKVGMTHFDWQQTGECKIRSALRVLRELYSTNIARR